VDCPLKQCKPSVRRPSLDGGRGWCGRQKSCVIRTGGKAAAAEGEAAAAEGEAAAAEAAAAAEGEEAAAEGEEAAAAAAAAKQKT
jgi:hypothetical protein